MSVFGLLAAVVADDFVDLNDDVFGDAGIYGSAINHLCEVDALLVIKNLDNTIKKAQFLTNGNRAIINSNP